MTKSMTPTGRLASAASYWGRLGKILSASGEGDDLGRVNDFFIPFLVLAIVAAVCVGWKADALGPVILWVCASFAAGGTAGFLFGIPKSGISSKAEAAAPASASTQGVAGSDVAHAAARNDAAPRTRPNTNLEEVSDWVTKILVGLTLVNFKDLKEEVARISVNAASAIRSHPTDSDVSVAMALVVGFALMGFLAVYLYMRLFVQGAFKRADDQLQEYERAVARAEAMGQREPEANASAAVAVVPSAASLRAAQDVADAAPANRPELVLQPLRELAEQYESLRRTDGAFSPERTRKMTEIARRMRLHAIAAAPYIEELTRSTSTGEHLAGTVIMQMRYLPEYTSWLVRRLVEERAFIGYQAASALLARVRVAGVPECKAIQAAVASAKEERAREGISEALLDQLIDQILEAK
ncbi:MAG: hypothetical protein ABJD97_01990 [Betaproteobacteria bacterium]